MQVLIALTSTSHAHTHVHVPSPGIECMQCSVRMSFEMVQSLIQSSAALYAKFLKYALTDYVLVSPSRGPSHFATTQHTVAQPLETWLTSTLPSSFSLPPSLTLPLPPSSSLPPSLPPSFPSSLPPSLPLVPLSPPMVPGSRVLNGVSGQAAVGQDGQMLKVPHLMLVSRVSSLSTQLPSFSFHPSLLPSPLLSPPSPSPPPLSSQLQVWGALPLSHRV